MTAGRGGQAPEYTVSVEQAVATLGVPEAYLTQLLDAGTISFELAGGERRIPARELAAYRARRAGAQLALRMMGGRPERPSRTQRP